MKPITLTTSGIERRIDEWFTILEAGSLPLIDLSQYTELSARALSILFAFAQAASNGSLLRQRSIAPLPIALPNNALARRSLIDSGFFSLATLPEPFEGAVGYAKQESTDKAGRRTRSGDQLTIRFRRILEQRHAGLGELGFQDECKRFLDELQRTFYPVLDELGFDAMFIHQFYKPVWELYQNIYMHSGTWGFSAVQHYSHGIVICFGDLGVGVKASLGNVGERIASRNGVQWSDAAAISIAFRDGVTSKPGVSQGYGLAVTRTNIIDAAGEIQCRSGSARVTINSRGERAQPVRFIPGVQIGIYLPKPAGRLRNKVR